MTGDHEDVSDTTVSLDDWEAIEEHLRRMGGTVERDGDRLELRAGSARFTVTRTGRVEAGMPLHDLQTDDVVALTFDHERPAIRLETAEDGVRYEFRVP
jgi:hypothetical protein